MVQVNGFTPLCSLGRWQAVSHSWWWGQAEESHRAGETGKDCNQELPQQRYSLSSSPGRHAFLIHGNHPPLHAP
ncbi:Laminin subunit beta-1 [Frankliniella fusca]|uniref:Laminin subunit beta-1 n=1 Tax=Frankliniella fusca TaxID=407009 RepID=A0AAE1LP36_9NEOP|nr:Laminin subunit beta-1 [Frankliniella fusca]